MGHGFNGPAELLATSIPVRLQFEEISFRDKAPCHTENFRGRHFSDIKGDDITSKINKSQLFRAGNEIFQPDFYIKFMVKNVSL